MTGRPNPLIREYSDAGKRISDAVSLHLAADPDGSYGKYMWFRLSDGTGDGEAYDTRTDAWRHVRTLDAVMYLQIRPGGLLPHHAERILIAHRHMHDAGYRIPHPEDLPEIDLPERLETWRALGLHLPNPRRSRLFPG